MGLSTLLASAIVGEKASIDNFKWLDMQCYDKSLIFTKFQITQLLDAPHKAFCVK